MWIWSKLSATKWADAWEERFYGHKGFVMEEIKGGKSVRVQVYCKTKKEAEGIAKEFGGSLRKLKNENWVAKGAQRAVDCGPILIRDAVVVTLESEVKSVQALREKYPERQVISIPPEMAFGTGDHPTTATCLRFLVDEARAFESAGEKWDLFDLGTGSGLLGIAGKLMGAGEVRAVDYDAKAIEVAELNVTRNIPKALRAELSMEVGDVFEITSRKKYELVVANLFSTILVEALPRIVKWMKKDGTLILSGILAEQWPLVKEAGEKAGLVFSKNVQKGKWMTALGTLR